MNYLFKALFIAATFCLLLAGCSLVKKAAGADIDPHAYLKARDAIISEVKLRESGRLAKRLATKDPIDNADIVFIISDRFLNKIARQYVGISGWLDEDNSFVVDSVAMSVCNGFCFATLKLKAANRSYNVDLNLLMDCLAVLEYKNKELILRIEPFNIAPDVSTGFLLSGFTEVIQNLVLINLGEMGSKFKGLKVPLNFDNEIVIPKGEFQLRDKLNADISMPEKILQVKVSLKEILFLNGRAVVALNMSGSKVK